MLSGSITSSVRCADLGDGFGPAEFRNAALGVSRVVNPALGATMLFKGGMEEVMPSAINMVQDKISQSRATLVGLAANGLKRAGLYTATNEASKRVGGVDK